MGASELPASRTPRRTALSLCVLLPRTCEHSPWFLEAGPVRPQRWPQGSRAPSSRKPALLSAAWAQALPLPCGRDPFISRSSLPALSLAFPGSVLWTGLGPRRAPAYAHPRLSPGVRSWALPSPFLSFVPLSVPEWVSSCPFVSEFAWSPGLSVTLAASAL